MAEKLIVDSEKFNLEVMRALVRLGFSHDTPVDIDTHGTAIIITPARDLKREAELQEAIAKVYERYDETFKNLA